MKLAAVFCALLVAVCSPAQRPPKPIDPAAAQLLHSMRTAYSSVKTAKISGTFTQYGKGNQVILKTEATYKAPNLFLLRTTGLQDLDKAGYGVISDGLQIYVSGLPGGSMVRKYTENNMWEALPQLNLETLCFWDWRQQFKTNPGGNMYSSVFNFSTDTWNGRSYTLLEEFAGNVHVRYFIDPKTSFIWRVETFDISARSPYAITTIDKMDINVPVDDKSFVVPKVAAKSGKG